MKARTKMALDSAVAAPAAWCFNVAARAAGRLVRRDHQVAEGEVRTIVVVKLLGMGSIIQATPLLRALKTRFPEARLVFITTAGHRDLIERLPSIDEAIYIDDRSVAGMARGAAAAVAGLLRRGVDLYFDLEVYSAATSILGLIGLARNRYGFYRTSARFKNGIFTHLVYFNVRMPVSRIYLQLHLASGGTEQDATALGPISITPDDLRGADARLADAGLPAGAGYLVINPNASDLLLERRWPMASFVATIDELARRGHHVVLVGAPSEAAYVGELEAALPASARGRVANLAGKLTLGQLFAAVSRASCVITNDTGPMHIAFAFDRPTVCLFGPSDPETYALARGNVEVLHHRVFCSPCAHELDAPPCAGNNFCMQLISPGEVLAAAFRLLGEAPPEEAADERRRLPLARDEIRYVDQNGAGLGIAARASIVDARRAPENGGGPHAR
ncbi:MAG: glycosyltransferase family 9 protein [Myxococcales bacterium]|nr:glycosyltransferase family 9 protein [Myxococcales bacterium]